MLKSTRIFAILAVLAACIGCSEPTPVNSEWCDIPTDGWRYGNTLTFNADSDSFSVDTLVLTIRHTSAYPYANLWLEMKYGTGDTLKADTLNVKLADDFGHWLGTGSGLSFQKSDTILPTAPIRQDKPILVRHIMRIDTLPQIQQIGLEYL